MICEKCGIVTSFYVICFSEKCVLRVKIELNFCVKFMTWFYMIKQFNKASFSQIIH